MSNEPKQVDCDEDDWAVNLIIGIMVLIFVIIPAIVSCFVPSGVDPF